MLLPEFCSCSHGFFDFVYKGPSSGQHCVGQNLLAGVDTLDILSLFVSTAHIAESDISHSLNCSPTPPRVALHRGTENRAAPPRRISANHRNNHRRARTRKRRITSRRQQHLTSHRQGHRRWHGHALHQSTSDLAASTFISRRVSFTIH